MGVQIVQEYSYVFAAVCPQDGGLDSLILPEVNTLTMSLFLQEVSQRHAEESLLMFLDGAGWHRSLELKIPENLHLLFLPPYSPQLNPVEHLWDEIREKWFANRVFQNLEGVESLLVEALRTLENDPQRVLHLTGFNWIIRGILNAI